MMAIATCVENMGTPKDIAHRTPTRARGKEEKARAREKAREKEEKDSKRPREKEEACRRGCSREPSSLRESMR